MSLKKNLLLVEDEPEQHNIYRSCIKRAGYNVFSAYNREEAKEVLRKQAMDILITDIHLQSSARRDTFEGFDVLKFAKENNPECLLICMSNDPKISTYQDALELGAMNFLKKPICSTDEFSLAIFNAREKKDYLRIRDKMTGPDVTTDLLDQRCADGLVLDDGTRETVYLLAQTKELPCIIFGETGTGKEEIAKLIHKKRVALEGPLPFVPVNCSNLDTSTAASQLFGHKKGSFTGADATTTGFVGEADGGILFLDEIHTLSLDCQRRLLRVLNDGSYQRLGDTKTLNSHFQVIVATGKNLDEMVQLGTFLPDLRSRITGIMINLLPLRERLNDMPLLVQLVLAKVGAKVEPKEKETISERCKGFYWQDNIRQLYNTLKASALICQCQKRPFTAADMQIYPSMLAPGAGLATSLSATTDVLGEVVTEVLRPLSQDEPFNNAIERYEAAILKNAIKRHGKISAVVDLLHISRSTLDMKRKKYCLVEE